MNVRIAVAFSLVLAMLVSGVRADTTAPARVCAVCGEVIEGPYFSTRDRFYHPAHFRCAYCDREIHGSYSEYQDRVYHTDCFRDHVALRCALCGDIISGDYLKDYWGNAYCQRHDGEAPVCDSCGRFISDRITGGGVRYDDGRYVCNICRPQSVTDRDALMELVGAVARDLETFGMEVDYAGMRIHLIGRERMQKLSGHHSDGLRGFTDYREDLRFMGYSRNRRIDMYLLYGMPRMEIVSTIAHELAHVWQFNHGSFQNDRAWSEGSCNYAAFLVLGRYPGRVSSFFRVGLTRDDDGVYGDGFRRVKALAESEGRRMWLHHLARDTVFPTGY